MMDPLLSQLPQIIEIHLSQIRQGVKKEKYDEAEYKEKEEGQKTDPKAELPEKDKGRKKNRDDPAFDF